MQTSGTIGAGLTDLELAVLHDVIQEKALYGDDEWVYGDGDDAVTLRVVQQKVENEAKKRKLWWAF